MNSLYVYVEINGIEQLVGSISGENAANAAFRYEDSYLEMTGAQPISISLPLQKDAFTPRQTKNFFEGLLPEGFSRQEASKWIHADEDDYLPLLAYLGLECIGAIKITSDQSVVEPPAYEALTPMQVKALAEEGAVRSTQLTMESRLSLTGASGKVGLYYDRENDRWYQPKGDAPSTHIVKQSHVRLEQIVVNEQLCLMTAKHLGICVPDCFIINLGEGREEDVLFATERYDRIIVEEECVGGLPRPLRLHQEDFAQALGIAAVDKYERESGDYLKRMFDLVRRYSANPIEDQLKLWDMVVYNYLIGNTDCHVKNFSFLYDRNLRGIRLAPAYDIISTRIYHLTREMSFSIGGDRILNQINRESFRRAAVEVGLGEGIALQRFDAMTQNLDTALDMAARELEQKGFPHAIDMRDRIRSGFPACLQTR